MLIENGHRPLLRVPEPFGHLGTHINVSLALMSAW
jgi:hypothetical protein